MSSRATGAIARSLVALLLLALLATACGSDDAADDATTARDSDSLCGLEPAAAAITSPAPAVAGDTITVLTHDSFAVSDEVLDAFEAEHDVKVEILTSADAGAMVAQAIQTADDPVADVMFGVDNTFLCRALEADIFVPYEAAGLDSVSAEFQVDSENRVTPVDFGDVCVNFWGEAYVDQDPPAALEDLTAEQYDKELVVQNPETSSPGFAFLLATIARFGDGWEEYWQDLRDRGVAVTSGWSEAYYTEFEPYGGERPLVVSYASSPVAELLFADPPVDEPPTGVMEDSCFRQIEFAGVLAGTDKPDTAAAFVDFMLTDTFQEDVPLNMFVFPVSETATLPAAFEEHAQIAVDPATMSPEEIEQGRLEWTDRWVEIVLR